MELMSKSREQMVEGGVSVCSHSGQFKTNLVFDLPVPVVGGR